MRRIHKILAGAAGSLAFVVATAVVAAPYGGMGPGMGGWGFGHMGPGMGGWGMGMMHGGPAGAMSAQYLDQLKTELAITAPQEPAWQAFAEKAAAQAALMQAMHAQRHQAADPNTPVPDRMTQHLGLMSQRLAGMQDVSAALKDLYAVLTPEQRSLADQRFGYMGPRGMGRAYGG